MAASRCHPLKGQGSREVVSHHEAPRAAVEERRPPGADFVAALLALFFHLQSGSPATRPGSASGKQLGLAAGPVSSSTRSAAAHSFGTGGAALAKPAARRAAERAELYATGRVLEGSWWLVYGYRGYRRYKWGYITCVNGLIFAVNWSYLSELIGLR